MSSIPTDSTLPLPPEPLATTRPAPPVPGESFDGHLQRASTRPVEPRPARSEQSRGEASQPPAHAETASSAPENNEQPAGEPTSDEIVGERAPIAAEEAPPEEQEPEQSVPAVDSELAAIELAPLTPVPSAEQEPEELPAEAIAVETPEPKGAGIEPPTNERIDQAPIAPAVKRPAAKTERASAASKPAPPAPVAGIGTPPTRPVRTAVAESVAPREEGAEQPTPPDPSSPAAAKTPDSAPIVHPGAPLARPLREAEPREGRLPHTKPASHPIDHRAPPTDAKPVPVATPQESSEPSPAPRRPRGQRAGNSPADASASRNSWDAKSIAHDAVVSFDAAASTPPAAGPTTVAAEAVRQSVAETLVATSPPLDAPGGPAAPAPVDLTAPTPPGSSPSSVQRDNTASAAPRPAGNSPQESTPEVDRARFVQRVARAVRSAGERGAPLRLRLSPPELGSLRLEVSVRQGVMTAKVEAETTAARAVLLEQLPVLRERLAEHQIQVARFDVELSGGFAEQPAADERRAGDGRRREQVGSGTNHRRGGQSAAAEPSPMVPRGGLANGRLNVVI